MSGHIVARSAGEDLDESFGEGRQVVGVAARDEGVRALLAHHDLLVTPRPPAFSMSVRTLGQLVITRPSSTPASTRSTVRGR